MPGRFIGADQFPCTAPEKREPERKTTMKKLLVASLALSLATAFSVLPSRAQEDPGKSLFETKCGICHSLDRPKAKKKDRAGWEKTVMRMKNANGCPITDDEAKAIIDHLAKNYAP